MTVFSTLEISNGRGGEAGGARLGLLLLVIAVAFCWGGIQGIYVAAQNREPLRRTMEEHLQAHGATRGKPDAAWLELQDAVAYIPGAGHLYNQRTSNERVPPTQVFVPLYAREPERGDEPSYVLLATSDPKILAVYNGALALKTDVEVNEYLQKHRAEVVFTRNVRGLVRLGLDLSTDDKKALRGIANLKDNNFIIIDELTAPSGKGGVFMLLLGLVIAILGFWQFTRAISP